MREFEIQLRSVQDVQDFVDLATRQPFTVLVSDDHHRVSGKSFMEMFCLNFSQRLFTMAECSDREFAQFRSDAQRFLADK